MAGGSFRSERRRYAREATGRWLLPAVRSLGTGTAGVLSALFLGGVAFGAQFFVDESEPTVAALATIILLFLIACLICIATYGYNYLIAPSKIWQKDQDLIKELRERLRPVIILSFEEEECIQTIAEGSVSLSWGGNRYFKTKRQPRHYLVRCFNSSDVSVDDVQIYVTGIKHRPSCSGG